MNTQTFSQTGLKKCSNVLPINDGVPQDSYVLVPFLFLIYINDVNDTLNFSKIHHFVHMIQIYCIYTSNSLKDITERLTMI